MPENENTAVATRETDAPPRELVVGPMPTAVLPDRETLSLIDYISGTVMRAGGGMVPSSVKTKEQAAAIMLAGWEMGLRPMTALRHVYLVNGKTQLEARAMMGVVRAQDPRIIFKVTEYTQQAVTIQMHRPGQPKATEVRYTVEDAKKSGQMSRGGPWQTYTRDMLYAAASARVCRIGAPDLINAIDARMPTVESTKAAMIDEGIIEGEVVVRSPDQQIIDAIPAEAYNDGDDGSIPVEVQAAEPEPDNVRQSDGPGADARREAQHSTTEGAGEPRAVKPQDEARALLKEIVGQYAPAFAKRVAASFGVEGKTSPSGAPAFAQYTEAEIEAAVATMRHVLQHGDLPGVEGTQVALDG